MDFLNTYFPFSPSASQPERPPQTLDGLPSPSPRKVDENVLKMRNGNYEGLREARKKGEKGETQVRFLAPISEGESLKSIKLTPKTHSTSGRTTFTPRSGHLEAPIVSMDEAVPFGRDENTHLNFFGFKIKVPENNNLKTGRKR